MKRPKSFLFLICFSLCITLSKQVSSRLTKTRVRTFFLAWELCLIIVIYYYYFLSHSRSRAGVSGEVARNEDGSPCQEEKGLSRPKLCSNFFSFFKSMICIMSLFRSTRVDLGKEGRPLRVYFLFELFHCSQTQLSDVTIPFPSHQLHYRQGNTISFPEQWYA